MGLKAFVGVWTHRLEDIEKELKGMEKGKARMVAP